MRFKMPGVAWLGIGLTAGALAAPTVVSAATAALVKIQGSSITKAHQLTTTETAPANFRQYTISAEGGIGGCQTLGTVPATGALIVTELRVAWRQEAAGDPVDFYAGPGCTGPLIGTIAAGFATSGNVSQTYETTIEPGFAIPAGTTLSVQTSNGASAFEGDIYMNGYAVPTADVPSVTGSG